jgi:hypothetical protein
MTITRSLTKLAALGLALLSVNCAGYRMGADKPAAMASVQKLAIPVFKNKTLEPRSSVLVTNNVVKQFQMDPTYQISAVEDADAVLRGTILKFERRQARGFRTNTLRSRELEIKIWVDYEVEEKGTGNILLRGSAQGLTSVFPEENFQLSERQAIDEASRKAAEEIVSRVAEGW